MKAQILAGIAAMALALRTPAGFAQTPMNPVAQVDRFRCDRWADRVNPPV